MVNMQDKMTIVPISMPLRQYVALREAADRESKSMAGIVREALRAVLMEKNDEIRKEVVR